VGAPRIWYDGLKPPGACGEPVSNDCRSNPLPQDLFATLAVGVDQETIALIFNPVENLYQGSFSTRLGFCAGLLVEVTCEEDPNDPNFTHRWHLEISADNGHAVTTIGDFFDAPPFGVELNFVLQVGAALDFCGAGTATPSEVRLTG
jgi:hypothetical protein